MYEECSKKELLHHMQNNEDAQRDILRKLQNVDVGEEGILKELSEDDRRTELLYANWTGEAAKKYVMRMQEETEMFRKYYKDAFERDLDCFQKEQKNLRKEQQAILHRLHEM